jgi:hypothetical protein
MWRRYTTPEADIKWQESYTPDGNTATLRVSGKDHAVVRQKLIKEFCIFSECNVGDVVGFFAKPKKVSDEPKSLFSRVTNWFAATEPKTVFTISLGNNYTYICDVREYSIPGNAFNLTRWHMSIPHPTYLIKMFLKDVEDAKMQETPEKPKKTEIEKIEKVDN